MAPCKLVVRLPLPMAHSLPGVVHWKYVSMQIPWRPCTDSGWQAHGVTHQREDQTPSQNVKSFTYIDFDMHLDIRYV
jgi:hypothetical protein